MNTKLVLLGVLCITCALIGITSAATSDSATQTINAEVELPTVTITAPIDVPTYTLERYSNNDKYIGDVVVSSTAPSDWSIVLEVTPSSESMYSTSSVYALFSDAMLTVDNGVTWEDLSISVPINRTIPASPFGPENTFNIWFRQFVTGTDKPADDYSITLTYSVSVIPPP